MVCVDDAILIGSDDNMLQLSINRLAQHFAIKDLGSLSYFLGVEVIPQSGGVLLSQHKYIQDLLQKVNMLNANDVHTPMSSNQVPVLNDGTSFTDATEYRSFVGGLQNLSLTHLDIVFAVINCHNLCIIQRLPTGQL